jgi:hypothetical protein
VVYLIYYFVFCLSRAKVYKPSQDGLGLGYTHPGIVQLLRYGKGAARSHALTRLADRALIWHPTALESIYITSPVYWGLMVIHIDLPFYFIKG